MSRMTMQPVLVRSGLDGAVDHEATGQITQRIYSVIRINGVGEILVINLFQHQISAPRKRALSPGKDMAVLLTCLSVLSKEHVPTSDQHYVFLFVESEYPTSTAQDRHHHEASQTISRHRDRAGSRIA